MSNFTYEFEEVALTLGKNAAGKQQRIGLITGSCEIEAYHESGDDYGHGWTWDITEITLSGPILHDPNVTIGYGHPLFQMLVNSLNDECGDKIWDACTENNRPDPDYEYDRRRDDRLMGVA